MADTGRLAIQVDIRGEDALSAPVLRAISTLARLETQTAPVTRQLRAAEDQSKALSQALSGVGRGLLSEFGGGGLLIAGGLGLAAIFAAGTRDVARFGQEASRSFVELERSIREVNTLFGLSGRAADDSFQEINRQVRDLSTRLGIDAVQASRAFYQAISANIPRNDAPRFLEVAGKTAIASAVDIKTASDALAATLQGFNLNASESTRVADILFNTVRQGSLRMDDIAHSIFQIAPAAGAANLSVEETAAALSTLTSRGVPAAQAAERLTALLLALQRPTDQQRQLFQDLNIRVDAYSVRARGLAGTLEDLNKASGGNANILLRLVGSQEALQASQLLLIDGGQRLAQQTDENTRAAGRVQTGYEEMDKGAGRAIDHLNAKWADFKRQIGEGLVLHVELPFVQAVDAAGQQLDVEGSAMQELIRARGEAERRTGQQLNLGRGAAVLRGAPARQPIGPPGQIGPPGPPVREPFVNEADETRRQNLEGRAEQTRAIEASAAAHRQEAQDAYDVIVASVNARHALDDQARAQQRAAQDAQEAARAAADSRQEEVRGFRDAADAANAKARDLRDSLSEMRSEIDRFMKAPVEGQTALERALAGTEQTVNESSLALAQAREAAIRAQLEGAPPPQLDMDALRAAAERRVLGEASGDVIRLRRDVLTGPVDLARRLATQPPELPSDAIIAGVQQLGPRILTAEANATAAEAAAHASQARADAAAKRAEAADRDAQAKLRVIEKAAQDAQRAAQEAADARTRAKEIETEGGIAPPGGSTPSTPPAAGGTAATLVNPDLPLGSAALAGATAAGPNADRVDPLLPPLVVNVDLSNANIATEVDDDRIAAIAAEQARLGVKRGLTQFRQELLGDFSPSAAPTLTGGRH